jgi:hypothetical protein
MILADTAFGSVEFLHGIRKLKYHAIVGVRVDRKLVDGRILRHLHKRGQQVQFVGLKFPVTVSWYYLKRGDGKLEKRFVLSTRPLKASTINWWGKRRWQIEGWFKTAKHRWASTSLWSRHPTWRVSLVCTVFDCLYLGTEELIYRSPLQIYLIGVSRHILHFKQYFHNYFCVVFYSTLNECVRLHLVMELTFKFSGARYKYPDFSIVQSNECIIVIP